MCGLAKVVERPVDDTCECSACCDARALRHAEHKVRVLSEDLRKYSRTIEELRAGNARLIEERDRYAGQVVALEAQCLELGHAVKADRAGKIPICVLGRLEEVSIDELVESHLKLRASAIAEADAAPAKPAGPCPACRDDRSIQAVAFDGVRCMACGRQITPEIPKSAALDDFVPGELRKFVPGELRKSTAHRPCVTVAGEDDRGVFLVSVPQARSISIDFP